MFCNANTDIVSESRPPTPPPGYDAFGSDQPLEDFVTSALQSREPLEHVESSLRPGQNAVQSQPVSSRPPLPPRPEPVVMAWIPEQAPNPTQITYSFSQISHNAMILVPPQDVRERDSRPLYHISWHEDFFMPGNSITTIRRGGSNDGSFVGEFNLKGGRKAATVRISNVSRWLSDVVVGPSLGRYRWQFSDSSPRLFWGRKNYVEKTCMIGTPHGSGLDARFWTPNYDSRSVSGQVCRLEVEPSGQVPHILDEIVISALVIERQRLIALSHSTNVK